MNQKQSDQKNLIVLIRNLVGVLSFVLVLIVAFSLVLIVGPEKFSFGNNTVQVSKIDSALVNTNWIPPDTALLPHDAKGDSIRYGQELIVHTSLYLGPKGNVLPISNGMNCQNCHLEAGTKYFGNNYSAVASTYPKFRARSGSIETIEKRINDCIERSLNGKALLHESREMRSMVAYIKWVGEKVPKGIVPNGAGLFSVPSLDVAADPVKGKILYAEKCSVCHGKNGEGNMSAEGNEYKYPPLWGKNSYNDAAGLYRLSRFAGYIKMNMPYGLASAAPLSDEEAWHLAAFVNSMERPTKDKSQDWPDISMKPIDHPFGPYSDGFSEEQHKFGPFKSMQKEK